MVWRDAHGKTLADYPRPSLAVDVALLTVDAGQLAVALHRRAEGHSKGAWSLPGTFVREQELLAYAALRALLEKTGIRAHQPTQLHVFDALDRDDRGRVISVAFADLVPWRTLDPGEYELVPLTGDPARPKLPGGRRRLAYDHDEIIAKAARWARSRYEAAPDPHHLIPEPFTLLELRLLHQAVAGVELQKDTFRRLMEPHLEPLEDFRRGEPGKPARLYRRIR